MKQQAQAAAELEASLNMPIPGSLNVSPSPPAATAPPSKAAATPSGWVWRTLLRLLSLVYATVRLCQSLHLHRVDGPRKWLLRCLCPVARLRRCSSCRSYPRNPSIRHPSHLPKPTNPSRPSRLKLVVHNLQLLLQKAKKLLLPLLPIHHQPERPRRLLSPLHYLPKLLLLRPKLKNLPWHLHHLPLSLLGKR